MTIDKIVVGPLETNCYVLSIDNQALVIDPGADINKINKAIGNKKVIGCVITHYHFDHIGCIKYFDKIFDIHNLKEGMNTIGPFTFEVIYTPGHKEDLICLYFKESNIMFVGDFIFKNGIGRCDLKGGNINQMKDSISKISKYKSDIIVYPGHGKTTILGSELKNINRHW